MESLGDDSLPIAGVDIGKEQMTETDEEVVARVLDMARTMPRKDADRRTTGASKWVQRLFGQISTWRKEGWSYEEIAELLKRAEVPLSNAQWSDKLLRTLYARERRRREKLKAAEADHDRVPEKALPAREEEAASGQ